MERNDFVTLTKEEYAELLHARVAFDFFAKIYTKQSIRYAVRYKDSGRSNVGNSWKGGEMTIKFRTLRADEI